MNVYFELGYKPKFKKQQPKRQKNLSTTIKPHLIIALLLTSQLCFSQRLANYQDGPLDIIKLGDPTLRQVAQEVPLDEIKTEEFQSFLDDMVATLKNSKGVGLAAPQVGISKRVFVMKSGYSIPLTILINPTVEYLESFGKKLSTEGCLSIPRKRVRVKRYKKVKFSYYNRTGKFVTQQARGLMATVVQHEYDHLNGVLIIDHLNLMEKLLDYIDYIAAPIM
ncbi:MAG: peptide deformylase [Bacteriovoracaceae bacterium]|nr:peptide deformylase [Bacteriovoracaceae bacterium]